MKLNLDDTKPIFQQISDEIEDAVFTGAFEEETQIPSTTEISAQFKINPATVLKGMNLLSQSGIIYKKRGIGMFVAKGATEKIRQKRQEDFLESYLTPMINEAKKLNLGKNDLINFIERGFKNEQN